MYRGEMDKQERRRNLKDFREGKIDYLISTDLASRGLDVEHVSRVVGRRVTGRADRRTVVADGGGSRAGSGSRRCQDGALGIDPRWVRVCCHGPRLDRRWLVGLRSGRRCRVRLPDGGAVGTGGPHPVDHRWRTARGGAQRGSAACRRRSDSLPGAHGVRPVARRDDRAGGA